MISKNKFLMINQIKKIREKLREKQKLINYISIRSISYSIKQSLVSYESKLLNLSLNDSINFYKIKDVSINIESGVIQKNNIVLKKFISPIIYESLTNISFGEFLYRNTYKLFRVKEDLIINKKRNIIYFNIKENKWNYYHFVYDNLLRFIFILEDYKEQYDILYNTGITNYANEYMDLLSIVYKKKLILFKNKKKIRIKNNIIFVKNQEYNKLGNFYDNSIKKEKVKNDNSSKYSIYNFPMNHLSKKTNQSNINHTIDNVMPKDYFIKLDDFISKLLNMKIIKKRKKKNIYCKRLTNNNYSRYKVRKVYDEEKFENFLKSKGFETVIFDNLSVIEQIDIMHNSGIVIGLFGANLTNTIYKQAGSLIEIIDEKNISAKHYQNICEQINLDFFSLNFKVNKNTETLINYKTLEKLLNKLN